MRGNGGGFYNPLKLNVINGYQFNPYFSMGIGTGIWYHRHALVPLFADFRAYLLDKKISPFLALDTGFIFRESIFLLPTFGVSWKLSKYFVINLSFGYHLAFVGPNDGGPY
ncbi:hypothetical protein ACFLRQ_00460 [Bacteroidota bacterium]